MKLEVISWIFTVIILGIVVFSINFLLKFIPEPTCLEYLEETYEDDGTGLWFLTGNLIFLKEDEMKTKKTCIKWEGETK